MMEQQNKVKTKCLRRSTSLRECGTCRSKGKIPSPLARAHLTEQFGCVSKSADNILVDISDASDLTQHGLMVLFNGFYRSQTVQGLVGTELPTHELETLRDRSQSFTGNTRGKTNQKTPSARRMDTFSEENINRHSFEKADQKPFANIKEHNSQDSTKQCVSKREKNGVQLQRCLSLYDRQRKPHSCFKQTSKTSLYKPSPWAYGGTHDKDIRIQNRKFTESSTSAMRHSSSGSFSFDSSDVRSRQSSRLSINSMFSSEFDFSSGNVTPSVSACSQSSAKAQPSVKASLSKSPTEKQPKPSLIPRPLRPQSAPPYRPTSAPTTPVTKSVHTVSRSMAPKASGKTLTRSISMTGRMTPSAPKSFQSKAKLDDEYHADVDKRKSQNDSRRSSLDIDELLRPTKTSSVYVSDTELNYPDPTPSKRPKSGIFNPKDYTKIDQYALKAPEDLLDSFDELLEYLLKDVSSTLARVRVIFRWIVSQHIPLDIDPKQAIPNTPLGFLYFIREKKSTYPELFATMCRRADIPCVIVYGIAKSVAYDVGDKVTHKKMKNSWNAVYIDDEWRFVHPYWARQSVQGYNSGRWAVVECDDFHCDDKSESRQMIAYLVNDFFFLTDPDKFITKCFPDEPCWQLLQRHLTRADFEALPFLQPAFYDLNLKVLNHDSCVIHAERGKVDLHIEMPQDKVQRYTFKYKLFVHRDWEAEGEYDQILLDRYLLHYVENEHAIFEIRFPVRGMYKLELHCYDSKRTLGSNWICDFKIICRESMPDCAPLPVVPSIGWGLNPALENAGMECLTHKTGVVNIDNESVTFLRFAISKDKEISVDAELLANKISWTELQTHVSVEQDEEHAVVKVAPPAEGEYALQVYVQEKDSPKKQNVCNFLMHRTKIVEDPELADIREELILATEAGDLDGLTLWIDRFIDKNMEDRGDLTQARKKLHLARFNRDIREAIARKDLSLLERTMQSCSDLTMRKSLGDLAAEAEIMRSRLRRLKRLRHAVLDMDQKTISEMRSYPKPPPAVHGVMAATFLLLGHKEDTLKKWSRIQGLISKRGKESLKKRVADFKAEDVSPVVLARARTMLAKYDLETVQIASIGAATFYQWASTMAGEPDI